MQNTNPPASRLASDRRTTSPEQVEISAPLLGKFKTLVLDNKDLAGLARCLPPDTSEGWDGTSRSPRAPARGGGLKEVAEASGTPLPPSLVNLSSSSASSTGHPSSPSALSAFSSDSNMCESDEEVRVRRACLHALLRLKCEDVLMYTRFWGFEFVRLQHESRHGCSARAWRAEAGTPRRDED